MPVLFNLLFLCLSNISSLSAPLKNHPGQMNTYGAHTLKRIW